MPRPLHIGTNKLIRQGATLVTATREIIEEFEFLKYKEIENIEEQSTEDNKKKLKNREYQKIYELIESGAVTINEICKKSGRTVKDINNILVMLEIEGYIIKSVGGYKCV